MNVEASQVTKLTITGAERLDPITVFIEDLCSRKVELPDDPNYITGAGKITIECFGESWSAYWGAMGPRSVEQFFTTCSVDYLTGCLARGLEIDREVFSSQALQAVVRRCIVECRRGRTSRWDRDSLRRDDARRLYDEAGQLSSIGSLEGVHYDLDARELLAELFGDEWHHAVSSYAMVPHPRRQYLARVVEAVQQALCLQHQAAAA